MHSNRQPILYIIAGPNGAGKTTASFNVLPTLLNCREFVNADEIARGLSPFDVEAVAIQAGKLMLERIEFLLMQRQTFAIETTLATNSYTNLVSRAQRLGYEVHLLFFWLSSPEVAYERVARRVEEGGHNIPRGVIERRYWRGLRNLFEKFLPIVDYWAIYDNNSTTNLIAEKDSVFDEITFLKVKNLCQKKI